MGSEKASIVRDLEPVGTSLCGRRSIKFRKEWSDFELAPLLVPSKPSWAEQSRAEPNRVAFASFPAPGLLYSAGEHFQDGPAASLAAALDRRKVVNET